MIQITPKCTAGAEPERTEHRMTSPQWPKVWRWSHSIPSIEIHLSAEGHPAEDLYLT